MSAPRRLTDNIASLAALQLVNYVAPLLTVPYLARVLQPAAFGSLSFAQGIVLYLAMLADFGFDVSATKDIAANRHLPHEIGRIVWSTFAAKGVLMGLSAMLLWAGILSVPKLGDQQALLSASFLYVIGTVSFPMWLFQGLERIRPAVIAFGSARILTLPALFCFVRGPQDLLAAAFIQASVEVVAAIFIAPTLWKELRLVPFRFSPRDVTTAFRQASPLFVSTCALFIATSSPAIVLGLVSSRTAVGYYSAADKLVKAAIAATAPISQALFPHISAAKAHSDEHAMRLIRKSLSWALLCSGLVSVLTFSFATPVCRTVFGDAFAPASDVLRLLSPLPLFFGVIAVVGTQTMVLFNMASAMGTLMLLSALAGVPAVALLAIHFGQSGAAIAYVSIIGLMLGRMCALVHRRKLPIWPSLSVPGRKHVPVTSA